LKCEKIGSALAGELNPELSQWGEVKKTNEVLADIYDVLSMINANFVAYASRKTAKQPDAYPRPGNQKNEQRYGNAHLTHSELCKKFAESRAKHGRND
jgi:hypothetical protein